MDDRFYVDAPLSPGPIEVDGPEAHHLAHVHRVHTGDRVTLFNGDGNEYPAEVFAVGKRVVSLHVLAIETPVRECGFPLEVAAPVPKADPAQFLIEKLTELGVTSFVPLRTQRSVVHPRDAKLDKLHRYVIEASKQCGRNVMMEEQALTDWTTHGRGRELPAIRVI